MNTRTKVNYILERALILIMGAMVICVLWQVASRYLLNSPSSWTDEAVRFLFMWVGLLGASYVTGQKMHLAIDILPSKLNPSNQRKLNMGIYTLVFFFALFTMVIGGARLVYITLTLGQLSPTLEIPLGYVYSVVPLSGLLIMYYAFINVLDFARGQVTSKQTL
jgi:TRAP-type C4-dicarboxylate transport system permease small subunit